MSMYLKNKEIYKDLIVRKVVPLEALTCTPIYFSDFKKIKPWRTFDNLRRSLYLL